MSEYSIGFRAASADIRLYGMAAARVFCSFANDERNAYMIGYKTRVALAKEHQAR